MVDEVTSGIPSAVRDLHFFITMIHYLSYHFRQPKTTLVTNIIRNFLAIFFTAKIAAVNFSTKLKEIYDYCISSMGKT